MSIFVVEGTVRHTVEPAGTELAEAFRGAEADVYDPYSTWVRLPAYSPRRASTTTHLVHNLLSSTGWSNRRLAAIVGTTHPTIGAIARGRQPDRVPGLYDALVKTADVVRRISILTHGNQAALNHLLTSSNEAGITPLRLLSEAKYGRALLLAMDLLGQADVEHLLTPTQSHDPSRDVISLVDEDDS